MSHHPQLDRVVITKMFAGIAHMQVCASADATDVEILAVCNLRNPSGTELGWSSVVRANTEFWPNSAPVKCAQDPTRVHFLVAC